LLFRRLSENGGQATQTPDDADTWSKDSVTKISHAAAALRLPRSLFRLYVAFRASLYFLLGSVSSK
jgi:hypothetical protein